jgi:hypothetical protein
MLNFTCETYWFKGLRQNFFLEKFGSRKNEQSGFRTSLYSRPYIDAGRKFWLGLVFIFWCSRRNDRLYRKVPTMDAIQKEIILSLEKIVGRIDY